MQLNAVIILKSTNEYKLDLYPAMRKIITINEVNILESPNEYYQKQLVMNEILLYLEVMDTFF